MTRVQCRCGATVLLSSTKVMRRHIQQDAPLGLPRRERICPNSRTTNFRPLEDAAKPWPVEGISDRFGTDGRYDDR